MINNIKGCYTQNTIRLLGCTIYNQPNHLINGDLGDKVKSPKPPNHLNTDLTKTNSKVFNLDDFGQKDSANQKDKFLCEREKLLNHLKKRQDFWVWTTNPKDKWELFKEFKPEYRLRQILDDEIVIEFDTPKKWDTYTKEEQEEWRNRFWVAINETAINIYNAGYTFEIWNHNGRSPHIHIRDLPITTLTPQQRSLFKKFFIKKHTPLEYFKFVDLGLTGISLIRLEYSPCWKGIFGIKELLYKFNPKEDKE